MMPAEWAWIIIGNTNVLGSAQLCSLGGQACWSAALIAPAPTRTVRPGIAHHQSEIHQNGRVVYHQTNPKYH